MSVTYHERKIKNPVFWPLHGLVLAGTGQHAEELRFHQHQKAGKPGSGASIELFNRGPRHLLMEQVL